ncbi:MAG: phosphotransferase [Vicinamibacterales bacterium]
MTTEPMIGARIEASLARAGLAPQGRLVPLTGDASDRKYFRVLHPDRGSVVLQVYSGAFEAAALPFANVARLFREIPLPIPAIVEEHGDLGILVLEDLGDVTLQASVGATPTAGHAALYRQAVALIATMQARGAELASNEYLPYGVSFDVDKLTWELDFFIKHFLEAYRGIQIPTEARAALRETFAEIVAELAAEPRVLCHRDYHSRNLMVHGGRLCLIDFQDARMGPDTYDLVSLLRDSYIELSESSVDELIAYFLALRGLTADERAFRVRFDLMALQRNLKALGTFGYQTATRRNPVYIQYIPRTLRYVRDGLAKYPRFADLRVQLGGWVDELR